MISTCRISVKLFVAINASQNASNLLITFKNIPAS